MRKLEELETATKRQAIAAIQYCNATHCVPATRERPLPEQSIPVLGVSQVALAHFPSFRKSGHTTRTVRSDLHCGIGPCFALVLVV